MEPLSELFPPGWTVLGDRGFAKLGISFKHLNTVITTPRFLGGRKRFSVDDVQHDPLARRCTCEVAYSRRTSESALQDVVYREVLPHIENIGSWRHVRITTLGKPLRTNFTAGCAAL